MSKPQAELVGFSQQILTPELGANCVLQQSSDAVLRSTQSRNRRWAAGRAYDYGTCPPGIVAPR